MAFVETLTQLVNRIEGCSAAIILGVDGIPIERWVQNPASSLDIDVVATEFTTLLRRAMHTAADTELGELREMVLATTLGVLLIRPITAEYFILIALNPGGNVGRARFELRKAQLALETEFAI
ncbi:MAG TPA: roadblock/LC7 domain-containing protein [Blastocatellia bacterium]|nr:roadblock/LC7 domain-containing protein [Blastocatellia bacterium]